MENRVVIVRAGRRVNGHRFCVWSEENVELDKGDGFVYKGTECL